jgi:hypothetical protein
MVRPREVVGKTRCGVTSELREAIELRSVSQARIFAACGAVSPKRVATSSRPALDGYGVAAPSTPSLDAIRLIAAAWAPEPPMRLRSSVVAAPARSRPSRRRSPGSSCA